MLHSPFASLSWHMHELSWHAVASPALCARAPRMLGSASGARRRPLCLAQIGDKVRLFHPNFTKRSAKVAAPPCHEWGWHTDTPMHATHTPTLPPTLPLRVIRVHHPSALQPTAHAHCTALHHFPPATRICGRCCSQVGDEVLFRPSSGQVVEGIVLDVGWYRTTIRSFEREHFLIPNSGGSGARGLRVGGWRCGEGTGTLSCLEDGRLRTKWCLPSFGKSRRICRHCLHAVSVTKQACNSELQPAGRAGMAQLQQPPASALHASACCHQ